MPRPKFLAFVKNTDNLKAAKEYIAAKNLPADFVFEGTIETACEKILEGARSPEYLIVELNSKDHDKVLAELDKLANCCEPDTKVVVIGEIDALSFYKELIHLGVSEYLLSPVKMVQLEKATTPKSLDEAKGEGNLGGKKTESRVISIVGARGGVGASTIALNLARTFSSRHLPTLILDFDPDFGVIPLMLDVEPSRGLVDALEKPDRIDALFLERVITKVNETLFVIGAEKNLGDTAQINNKTAQVMLDFLKSKFAYIIIDIPRIETYNHYFLQHSETIVVTELSIPGLRDTMRIFDLINDTLHNKRITLVANKVGVNKKYETPVKDFESGLGRKVDAVIGFESSIYGYNNGGEAIVNEIKDLKFTKSIEDLAAKFMGDEVLPAPAKAGKPSFLDKLLPKK